MSIKLRVPIVIITGLLGLAAWLISGTHQTPIVQAGPVSAGGELNYPRLGLYDSVRAGGWPLLNDDGTLNASTLDQTAKYQLVTIDATPLTDLRPDVIGQLRQRNPAIKLLAYVLGHLIWYGNYDSFTWFKQYWTLINDGAGPTPGPNASWLYYQSDPPADPSIHSTDADLVNVNLAKRIQNPDGSYTYTTAAAIAQLMAGTVANARNAAGQRLWDGLFLDVYCPDIPWIETPTKKFDYVRAGYVSAAEFFQGWTNGQTILGETVRSLIDDPNFIISGNCTPGAPRLYGSFNGWMQEYFPQQEGGTWYTNMYWPVGGYFQDKLRYRAPQYNFISSNAASTTGTTAIDRRLERFGLGSASLGAGFSFFGNGARVTDPRLNGFRYDQWWYDEYAVNLATGRSTTNASDTGWLGQPTTEAYQMVWLNPAADLITANNGFENGLAGWTAVTAPATQSTITTDDSTVAVGARSLRADVGQSSSFHNFTSVAATDTFPVTAGLTYGLTFWAKASAARTIDLVLDTGGAGTVSLPITTAWRQYQLPLTPSTANANATVRFDLAAAAGAVWLDDVHFQTGLTNVYRRDFDHGAVLVNPSAAPQTVTLEKPYQKILGTAAPEVNDGSVATSVTANSSDALFLLSVDVTPPAAVTDLRAAGGAVSPLAGARQLSRSADRRL